MKDMSKQIQELCQVKRRRPKEVIDDMVQMTINTIITQPIFMEQSFPNTLYHFVPNFYTRLIRYEKDPTAMSMFQELCLTYTQTIQQQPAFTDVLGSLYDQHLGEDLGQFLSPPDIANLLGELSTINGPILEQSTIGDDCCGAGSLVLGQLRSRLQSEGKASLKLLHIHINDIDMNMVKMATAQIVLSSAMHRIPIGSLTAHHGNALLHQTCPTVFQWYPALPKRIYEEFKVKQNLKVEELEAA